MRFKTAAITLAVLVCALLGSTSIVVGGAEPAMAQQTDDDVPPGNPVIGSDRPGDIEPENDTNYGLWALLAICLIGAGFLLVRIERWEGRKAGRLDE